MSESQAVILLKVYGGLCKTRPNVSVGSRGHEGRVNSFYPQNDKTWVCKSVWWRSRSQQTFSNSHNPLSFIPVKLLSVEMMTFESCLWMNASGSIQFNIKTVCKNEQKSVYSNEHSASGIIGAQYVPSLISQFLLCFFIYHSLCKKKFFLSHFYRNINML